jgi:glycosyltransferase involved in cell wall biosynthesis
VTGDRSDQNRRLRVCFISLKAYDLLAGVPQPRYVGGAERQQTLIAREFAARGHAVSFITLDYGQPDGIEHRGVKIFKAYDYEAGVPILRFFYPRWTGLDDAMARASADVYYQMGADSETGQIAAWCGRHGRRFVFATASDSDCDRRLPRLPQRRRRWLYRFGVKRANRVVTQTEAQERMMHESFGLNSVVIKSCTGDPGWDADAVAQRLSNARIRLLWVGRFVPVKRLEMFFDLAVSHPDWELHVAGDGDRTDPYVRGLWERGATLPNVTLHGVLGDSDLHQQYMQASALVCTSSWEGVPNTFLESWARGLLVVSTVDPDTQIVRFGLGAATSDEGLSESIESAVRAASFEMSARLRAYFLDNYSIDACVSANERLFLSIP